MTAVRIIRRFTCGAVAMAVLCGVPKTAQLSQQPGELVIRLLDAYAQGRPEQAVAALRDVGDFQELSRGMVEHAPVWIAAAAAQPERDRRRRVAALVALEAGRVALDSADTWAQVRELVEWGCVQVRSGPPTEFERVWLLASISLIHGAGDIYFLTARAVGGQMTVPFAPIAHRDHARQRFPDQPRFHLAPIVLRREVVLLTNRPGVLVGYFAGARATAPEVEGQVRETIDDLRALTALPAVEAEARLRMGILWFQLGDLQRSIDELGLAASLPGDPFVSYLAHLFSGLAHDHGRQPAAAIQHYEAALRVRPHARSGVTALAASLFLTPRRGEASALIDASFAVPSVVDPWRTHAFGDLRFWPEYLAQLRNGVRP